MIRVGVDVGGTFTDLFAWDEETGAASSAKTLTTRDDLSRGVLTALEMAGIELTSVGDFIHGSTTATNALIERNYPEPALLTTAGFRDTIEIGRMHRERLYDPYQSKPQPLVRRRNRFTVSERMRADGTTRDPLDEDGVRAAAREIAERELQSVAVGFINSYANPAHEERAREILLEEHPGANVALSSDIPKFRELGRFVTTAVRAALLPVMGDYLERLESAMRERGFSGRFFVIKSNGGIMTAAAAKERPEELIESGPAGGVAAASYLSELTGEGRLVLTDMGGTSFDVCLIEEGQGLVRDDYEIDWDNPIITPMLDIRSIGAGGGSIAWIDDGGSLRVGPRSAGSSPGPACYGLGGTEPTVTDANLLLGRLDPTLGGKMDLDVEAAEAAVKSVAEPLGMELYACAEGVIRICAESMASAIKMVSTDRGRDPRDHTLVSFGGAGAMHAWAIAPSVGIDTILVPPMAGVASAFGATAMDVRHDVDATCYMECDQADLPALTEQFDSLAEQAASRLRSDGFAEEEMAFQRVAGMRYVGQSYEVDTPISDDDLTEEKIGEIVAAFHVEHEREHGVSDRTFRVAFVNLRVTGSGSVVKPSLDLAVGARDGKVPEDGISERQIYFDGEFSASRIYDGTGLSTGSRLEGPAVVEYPHATVIVPPGASAEVDQFLNLKITTAGSS